MKLPKTLLATIRELRRQASSLHVVAGTKVERYFDEARLDRIISKLDEAEDQYRRKQEGSAWRALVEAGKAIGYLHGLAEGLRRNEPQQLLARKLSAIGKTGGDKKGANGQPARDKVAALLITAVKKNRWTTKKRIVAGYDEILSDVPELPKNNYQKGRIFALPEVKAILPPK